MKTVISKVVMAASALALSASASAVDLFGSDLKIDTGNPAFATLCSGVNLCTGDADSVTGVFDELGFSQFLATSVYDLSDGTLAGSFYDTNDPTTLGLLGIPGTYPNLSNTGNVTLALPLVNSQVDIDALSPLAPPLNTLSDNEGFLTSWNLLASYTLLGNLDLVNGPSYTGGFIDFYFQDVVPNTLTKVLTLSLTGSTLQAANLELDFDVTYALAGFFLIDAGAGFVDLSTLDATAQLDTNVNPPIPTPDQLAVVDLLPNSEGGLTAIRQTTLDGSIGMREVPAPGSLMLLGLGLGLLGFSARKKLA